MTSLSHFWDLTLVLTKKEIKVRYKNHFLGYLWSIANPLAFALIFYVVFTITGMVKEKDYAIFLITGLFPWQWFSNSVSVSPTIFLGNGSIIKKIYFPRSIIPLAIVLQDMIHFVLSIPVIVFFLLILDRTPSLIVDTTPSVAWLYGIPILLVIQLCLTYGFCLVISSTNLFFRDMEKLTNIFVMFLFYCTPVLYSVNKIPPEYKFLVDLNPLAALMISWRSLLLHGCMEPRYLALAAMYAALASAVGYLVYKKLSWKFAEVL